MVIYTCENCLKIFYKKSDFINHTIKKKKPCAKKAEFIPLKTAENR